MIGKIVDAALMLWQSFSTIEKLALAAWGLVVLAGRMATSLIRQRQRRDRELADYLLYRMRAEREQPA